MEHTMTICYCEDESAQAKAFAIKIDQWAKNRNMKVRTDLFECAEEYLFKAEQNYYDVIFLDISMRGQNGMELARKIREKEKDVILVFVTSDASYVFDGYEVGAYRYLMKPVDEKKLWEILDYARTQNAEDNGNYILVKKDGQSVRVDLNDMLYIEAQKHYVNLYLEDQESMNIKNRFHGVTSGDAGKIRNRPRNASKLRSEYRESCPDWKNGMCTYGWQCCSGQPELL